MIEAGQEVVSHNIETVGGYTKELGLRQSMKEVLSKLKLLMKRE